MACGREGNVPSVNAEQMVVVCGSGGGFLSGGGEGNWDEMALKRGPSSVPRHGVVIVTYMKS